ncbi:hypothetical protein [Trueperella bialowiezensis]|uniref:SpaA-like prealbumin fold domain-containing protein n=1 Tax=Trueperella bialowiezensis TaxID=312285 RepID=A0A448PGI7_9ACTO|nr:hypothetical protein [Trueperella bialowiezensis]VEI14016.1 Uncharacterised protein [Trueperella bialowiezensis]
MAKVSSRSGRYTRLATPWRAVFAVVLSVFLMLTIFQGSFAVSAPLEGADENSQTSENPAGGGLSSDPAPVDDTSPADDAEAPEAPAPVQQEQEAEALEPASSQADILEQGRYSLEQGPALSAHSRGAQQMGFSGTSRSANALSCDPGVYYGLSLDDGQVWKLTGGGAKGTDPERVFTMQDPNSPKRNGKYNGLAVGDNGKVAYAYNIQKQRNSSPFLEIYRWDAASNETKKVFDARYNLGGIGNNFYLIAGGMSPNKDGKFYFGGYKTVDKDVGEYRYDRWGNRYWHRFYWQYSVYFHLYEFSHNPSGHGVVRHVGLVEVDSFRRNWDSHLDPTSYSTNGDLAFDAQGNMMILYHNATTGDGRLVTVRKAALDAAIADPGKAIATAPLPKKNPYGTWASGGVMFNGLAVNRDGTMVAGYVHSGETAVRKLSAATGEQLGEDWKPVSKTLMTQGQTSQDLASCNFPPTILVDKDFKGRADSKDQAELILGTSDDINNPYVQVTTAGTENGVQPEYIGPAVVRTGHDYFITERFLRDGTPSADAMKSYQKQLTCTMSKQPGSVEHLPVTPHVVGENYVTNKVTIPAELATADYPEPAISCRYTNTPVQIDVTKNFAGRADSSDQVKLVLNNTPDFTDPLAEATTAGTATGVQDQKIAPTPVSAGGTYYVAEQFLRNGQEDGTAYTQYNKALTCTAKKADGTRVNVNTAPADTNPAQGFVIHKVTLPADLTDGSYADPAVSCQFTNTPATLEVTKNFEGRRDVSDQVDLIVTEKAPDDVSAPLDNAAVASVTTAGNAPGVQNQKITSPIKAGTTYYITERFKRDNEGGQLEVSDQAFNAYDKELTCTVTKDGGQPQELTATPYEPNPAATNYLTYKVVIPGPSGTAGLPIQSVNCQFTNTPRSNLTLVKIVEDEPTYGILEAADPSEFKLRAQKEGATDYAVDASPTDDASLYGNAKSVTVENLSAGTYTLSEVIPDTRPYYEQDLSYDWTCEPYGFAMQSHGSLLQSRGRLFEAKGDGTATVNLPSDIDVICFVTNTTSAITVLKDFPTGDPAQIKLSATPDAGDDGQPVPNLPKLDNVAGSNEPNQANTMFVKPGHKYTLSETSDVAYLYNNLEVYIGDPKNPYDSSSWDDPDVWESVVDEYGNPTTVVSTDYPGEHKIYRFVNTNPSVPGMPLTGGMSRDAFLIGAAALVVIGATAITATWWWRRRTTK